VWLLLLLLLTLLLWVVVVHLLLLWALCSCCRTLWQQVATLLQLAWMFGGDIC
jgi:hypothetical protein